jgi:hypothetical protein
LFSFFAGVLTSSAGVANVDSGDGGHGRSFLFPFVEAASVSRKGLPLLVKGLDRPIVAYFPVPPLETKGLLLLLSSLAFSSLPFCKKGFVLLLVKMVSLSRAPPLMDGLKCVTEMGGVGSELLSAVAVGESRLISFGLCCVVVGVVAEGTAAVDAGEDDAPV